MNELAQMELAACEYRRVLRSSRFLGWAGASTTTGYVSEQDYERILKAGKAMNDAYAAAQARAFL